MYQWKALQKRTSLSLLDIVFSQWIVDLWHFLHHGERENLGSDPFSPQHCERPRRHHAVEETHIVWQALQTPCPALQYPQYALNSCLVFRQRHMKYDKLDKRPTYQHFQSCKQSHSPPQTPCLTDQQALYRLQSPLKPCRETNYGPNNAKTPPVQDCTVEVPGPKDVTQPV